MNTRDILAWALVTIGFSILAVVVHHYLGIYIMLAYLAILTISLGIGISTDEKGAVNSPR